MSSVAPPATLSERINRLFEVVRPPEELSRKWSNREVVTACRSAGRELSESHLSELRRGVKANPTLKTLDALAWFFGVRTAYFTDPLVAAEVERELAERESRMHAELDAQRSAEEDLLTAGRELQRAMRAAGVTSTAHRGTRNPAAAREQASMMRALAKALLDDEEDENADS
ncbi:hypothetical protein [Nocardia wallacei]|uniref:hypothetical protein n=1 Tax=Nocardia wallacei TaxID=480035 RepID=UPI002456095C|nr:hypothetical protein [Nocardia wallacei]